MADIRIFAFLLILLIIINCAFVRARNSDDLISREKRMFGCAKAGKKCSGFFGKSCCGGLVCNTTIKKCVTKGSPISWLADRNGK